MAEAERERQTKREWQRENGRENMAETEVKNADSRGWQRWHRMAEMAEMAEMTEHSLFTLLFFSPSLLSFFSLLSSILYQQMKQMQQTKWFDHCLG